MDLESRVDEMGKDVVDIKVCIAQMATHIENQNGINARLEKLINDNSDRCNSCAPIVGRLAKESDRNWLSGVLKAGGIIGGAGAASYAASAAAKGAATVPTLTKIGLLFMKVFG